MDVFTSGRDYRPHTAFGNHLPSNAVYVRVLVAADTFDAASDELGRLSLHRYQETLRGPADPDGPADAIEAYVRDGNATTPAVFALYRIEMDALGEPLNPPRLLVAEVQGSELVVRGRVRVVGTGRPDAPAPISRIVPDDDQADPVPLADKPTEGPAADVDLVESPIAYPDGALGDLTKGREKRLVPELDDIKTELEMVINAIERARRSTDPRVSWGRESGRLLDLSWRLAATAGDAATVETILQARI